MKYICDIKVIVYDYVNCNDVLCIFKMSILFMDCSDEFV